MLIDRRYMLNPDAWDPRTVSSIGADVDVTTLDGLANMLIGPTAAKVVKVTTSVVEFAFIAIGLTVWLAFGVPESIGFMAPGPGWADVYAAATVLFVIAFITPLVTLVRPTWTRFRAAAHALVDFGLIPVLAWSLALGSWVVLVDPATATAEEADLVNLINQIVRVSIAFTIVLVAVSGALEVRRYRQIGVRT